MAAVLVCRVCVFQPLSTGFDVICKRNFRTYKFCAWKDLYSIRVILQAAHWTIECSIRIRMPSFVMDTCNVYLCTHFGPLRERKRVTIKIIQNQIAGILAAANLYGFRTAHWWCLVWGFDDLVAQWRYGRAQFKISRCECQCECEFIW